MPASPQESAGGRRQAPGARERSTRRQQPGVRRTSTDAAVADDVVLVAPSGYGKSAEMFQEARRRRASGSHAIAAVATAVTEDGLESALNKENRDAFAAWMKSADPATVFIDAVDELALRRKSLHDLLRKLDAGIPFAQRRAQLVITARTGMWLPQHTGELQNFLAVARGLQQERSGVADAKKSPGPLIRQITFARLDHAALLALAVGNGVNDADAFLACLRTQEISSLFDIRPRDVCWLVRKWNQSRRLGKWSELMTDFCDSALEDETPERALQRDLSLREGHRGLERTAAGMLFGRRGFISVPSAERSDQTISSRRLFDDWTTAKVQSLLETALFVHKGMNGQAVQFAADALTPFLAARWLAERARSGLDVDGLRDLVMVRAFGEADFHIPHSRTKLAGWLASALPTFRALVLETRPELVLFEGDPDLLTDRELEAGLLGVADKVLRGVSDLLPTSGTLRKLARSSVEHVVLSLLSTRPTIPSLQMFVLPLVQFGHYRSCIPLALSLALDRRVADHVRADAIGAVLRQASQLTARDSFH